MGAAQQLDVRRIEKRAAVLQFDDVIAKDRSRSPGISRSADRAPRSIVASARAIRTRGRRVRPAYRVPEYAPRAASDDSLARGASSVTRVRARERA